MFFKTVEDNKVSKFRLICERLGLIAFTNGEINSSNHLGGRHPWAAGTVDRRSGLKIQKFYMLGS
jgi:hypothetical protein